ncbi:MAG TPA: hypothetical protein VHC43_08085 [Mycobacteriales bacterium]|nr:hypothetical protein [Mycobacteriales bacterium]
MIDDATWHQAALDLNGFAEEAALAARLADQSERLEAYRGGDEAAGVLAVDALDQLEGILGDLERDLPRLRAAVAHLVANLPPGKD